MINFCELTTLANLALNKSLDISSELGHMYIGCEHILYGFLTQPKSSAYNLLIKNNIDKKIILENLETIIGKGSKTNLNFENLTPKTQEVLEYAIDISKKNNYKLVGTEHMLLAILEKKQGYAFKWIKDYANYLDLIYDCKETIKKQSPINKGNITNLKKEFYNDITLLAKQDKLDPVLGRCVEIDRMIQILARRSKNNPCLIGEAGVGKSAIVEGLAQKIVDGKVPNNLINKKVISLDVSSMLAGAKYRGDFEERIKDVLNSAINDKNTILFIDEIHTIMGAGSSEGSIDAANMLKPQLARGEIQIIGATTIDEYKKYIEKDMALERRLQPIIVNEPTLEQSKQILEGLKSKFEKHHNVKITNQAITSAVELSNKYVTNRYLPDKAIDLIDEACSKVKINKLENLDNLKKLEQDLKKIKIKLIENFNNRKFVNVKKIRKKQVVLKNNICQIENKIKNKKNIYVKEKDIQEIISSWSTVPVTMLNSKESDNLINLENVLKKRIIGQDEAIKKVANALIRGRIGLKDENRPIGSFIFLGPTGVGKTEICKEMSRILFGDEKFIVRLDMSEYMEKHSVSKIIGSPPGYVGYDKGGQLTEQIKTKPYSIILFDEIEKAHPDVFNILLQILEDGILTDSRGKKVDFKNTILIMTSNVGAELVLTKNVKIGFANYNQNEEKSFNEDLVLSKLKENFKPEFLNRIDDIIVFNNLSKKDIEEICKLFIQKLEVKTKKIKINIEISEQVLNLIVKTSFDKNYGARKVRKVITDLLENKLSYLILKKEIKPNDNVLVILENQDIKFIVKK